MIASPRLSHEVIIGRLKKGAHSRVRICPAVSPNTNGRQSRNHRGIRSQEEPGAPSRSPNRKIVSHGLEFAPHLFNTEDLACTVLRDEPIPERRTEVEALV